MYLLTYLFILFIINFKSSLFLLRITSVTANYPPHADLQKSLRNKVSDVITQLILSFAQNTDNIVSACFFVQLTFLLKTAMQKSVVVVTAAAMVTVSGYLCAYFCVHIGSVSVHSVDRHFVLTIAN